MRKEVLLIFLIILATPVFGKEIYSGTVDEDTYFTTDGLNLSARYYESTDKISLHLAHKDQYILIDLLSCGDDGDISYCFDDVETEDREVNISGGLFLKEVNRITLSVYKRMPEITLDMESEETDLQLNDRTEATITLENVGDKDATDVRFEMTLPDEIELQSTTMTRLGDKLIWTPRIKKGDMEKATLVFKTNQFSDISLDGVVKYSTGMGTETDEDSLDFTVRTPFNISVNLSDSLVEVNERVDLILKITNTDTSESLTINDLKVSFPRDIDIKGIPAGFTVQKNVVTKSLSVSPGRTEELSFRFQSKKKGDYAIKSEGEFIIRGNTFKESSTSQVGIGTSGLFPLINLSSDAVKGYDTINGKIWILNRGDDNITTGIKVKSDTFPEEDIEERKYLPGEKKLVYDRTITAPSSEVERQGYLGAEGSYTDERGRAFSFDQEAGFTILPEEKLFKVTQEAQADATGVDVKVFLENLKDNSFSSVEIFDLLPKGFQVEGSQTSVTSLNRAERKKVLEYRVIPPASFNDTSFIIDHTINVEEGDSTLVQEQSLRVDIDKAVREAPEESTQANETNETQPLSFKEKQELKKEQGFFGRVWANIKGIFLELFRKG